MKILYFSLGLQIEAHALNKVPYILALGIQGEYIAYIGVAAASQFSL